MSKEINGILPFGYRLVNIFNPIVGSEIEMITEDGFVMTTEDGITMITEDSN